MIRPTHDCRGRESIDRWENESPVSVTVRSFIETNHGKVENRKITRIWPDHGFPGP